MQGKWLQKVIFRVPKDPFNDNSTYSLAFSSFELRVIMEVIKPFSLQIFFIGDLGSSLREK